MARAEIDGVELTLEHQIDAWTLAANLTWQDARNADTGNVNTGTLEAAMASKPASFRNVDTAADDTVRALDEGRIDAFFNNAGIAQTRPFLSITEEDWRRVMDVNGLGVLIGMQEAVKQFQSQGKDATGFGGRIVNTASIAGKQGYEPLAHYCASKFGVVALTQAAARAFGKDGISANAICPGVVATDMWKVIDKGFKDEGLTARDGEAFDGFAAGILLGRASVSEDLAGVAVFLASPASDYMTGQSLVVDGGMVFV